MLPALQVRQSTCSHNQGRHMTAKPQLCGNRGLWDQTGLQVWPHAVNLASGEGIIDQVSARAGQTPELRHN